MKRAKLMLTAIVILAGVGGALAFKAQKFGAGDIYCKFAGENTCRLVDYATQDQGLGITNNPCATAAITTLTYTTTNCTPQNAKQTAPAFVANP